MLKKIAYLVIHSKIYIKKSNDIDKLEKFRIEFLGKRGFISKYMNNIRFFSKKNRPSVGMIINKAKQEVQNYLKEQKNYIENEKIKKKLLYETLDVTLSGRRMENGGLHPISQTIEIMEKFFVNRGFSITTGPEIEDDYHNFDALNIPNYHPARSYNDSFRIDSTKLLRTQTSNVQIRIMKNNKPPIRIIASGRVYRKDYDKTHTPMFHQMEGLLIDKGINFANLKGTMFDFLKNFFLNKLNIRFRPSYFPFTEPSAEVDVMLENGSWLEILGCGLLHPNVLINVGIDHNKYSGFAFGIGIERLTMLRYGIKDLRYLFENDIRFLKQFKC